MKDLGIGIIFEKENINTLDAKGEVLLTILSSLAQDESRSMGIYFTIKLFRIKSPSHIFTEEEIKEVLRAGNDFRNNRLVIDEEGYAQLIDSDLHYES